MRIVGAPVSKKTLIVAYGPEMLTLAGLQILLGHRDSWREAAGCSSANISLAHSSFFLYPPSFLRSLLFIMNMERSNL